MDTKPTPRRYWCRLATVFICVAGSISLSAEQGPAGPAPNQQAAPVVVQSQAGQVASAPVATDLTTQARDQAALKATGTGPSAPQQPTKTKVAEFYFWLVFAFVSLFLFTMFRMVLSRLSGTWSLGEALSEVIFEQPTPPAPAAGGGAAAPGAVAPAAAAATVRSVASSSRLIAFVGMVVLAAMLLGVGYYMLWALFHGGELRAMEGVWSYFLGGSALFAPYAVNKLADMIRMDGPRPSK
jgi:hypothetical protein